MTSPICKTKQVVLADLGEFTAYSGLIGVPRQWIVYCLGPILLPDRARKLIHSPLTNEYCTQSWPPVKPDQRIHTTVESILQPLMGREPNQQSHPAVLSLWHIPTSLSSEPQQLPCPKMDHNSQFSLPMDITIRHIQKGKWRWLVKNYLCPSKPVVSVKGNWLLRCVDTNVRYTKKIE